MISIRKGTIIAGKYRLEDPLARGGMGAIWTARHLQLDVLIAVKFIDPDFAATAEGRARFEREAKSAAMLHSPNVVQIHDYGVEFETPYLAMELLQGEDLSARLKREGRLSLESAAKVAIHVSKALRKAHDAGVIHRDLKPSNIFMVHGDDDEELVKVLDFGVAKLMSLGSTDEDETKRGALIGSPRYMSPEQARRNREIDHRSDLWSLGVILFRAVTGQLPFPGDEVADVLVKICSEPLPIPSELAPDLGAEVDRFFLKALARDPDKRYQTAREMALDFAALVGASTATSRFNWPMPSDGMRISWVPGLFPIDYSPQGSAVAMGGLGGTGGPGGSTAGKTPWPGGPMSRSRTPTLQPAVSLPQVSMLRAPVSHAPASLTSPSPVAPLASQGRGPSSFEPVSETLPLTTLEEAMNPGSTPTQVDETLVMADRRDRDTGRARAEALSRGEPGHGPDDGSREPAEDGRRITPPTRVVDSSIDETRRSSAPSPSISEPPRRPSVRASASPSVGRAEGKGRDGLPGANPSATLTSSNGTVDIPPGRASVRARRTLTLWIAVAAAVLFVAGALAVVRLRISGSEPASAGSTKEAPSGVLTANATEVPPKTSKAPLTNGAASAEAIVDAPEAPARASSAKASSSSAPSAPPSGKPAPVPEGGR